VQKSFFVLFSFVSLAASQNRIKGTKKLGGGLFGARLLSSSVSPVGAIFHDPIEQGLFKADVFSGFFAFDPLVFQDLGTFGEKLLIQDRILNELRLILLCRRHLRIVFHKIGDKSIKSALPCGIGIPADLLGSKPMPQPFRRDDDGIYLTLFAVASCGHLVMAASYEDFGQLF